jgi:modulator of FtsH protease HflK
VMSNSSKVMIDVEGGGNNMMVLPLDQILQRSNTTNNNRSDNFSAEELRQINSQLNAAPFSPNTRTSR